MSMSGGYFYPGQYGGAPAQGSGVPYIGRGPVDAFIIGGVTLSATLSASDGTTNTELVTLSGTVFSQTGTFSADAYSTVFNATDVQYWSNLAITLINNSVNNLKSASVDFSPNNNNWEIWDSSTFATLSSSAVLSMQISSNSRKWLRVRAWSSGSGGSNTGSLDVYVTTNNG